MNSITLGPENEPGTMDWALLWKGALYASRACGWENCPSYYFSMELCRTSPFVLQLYWRFSCPEYSLTYQKDTCYISFAFYLCDLVKIETILYPHLFSTFVHFTIVLTYFLYSVGVWSSGHSSGSEHCAELCNFNCGLSTEHRACNEKRFTGRWLL